jgi:phosphohistidine swiveling domain-containing protein
MGEILAKGICVNPGYAKGESRVVNSVEDIENISPGSIVILPESHPMYALAVMSASAIICESGGKLSHICIVSMEMGIPCITQAAGARKNIGDGRQIYVDAERGEVYLAE